MLLHCLCRHAGCIVQIAEDTGFRWASRHAVWLFSLFNSMFTENTLLDNPFLADAQVIGMNILMLIRRNCTGCLGGFGTGSGAPRDHLAAIMISSMGFLTEVIGADNAVLSLFLWRIHDAVRAGFLTAATTDAAFVVMHRDPIRCFEHRLGGHRTCLDAWCVTAVIAQHRDGAVSGLGEFTLFLTDEISPVEGLPVGAALGIVFGLTSQGTGAAADTLLQVYNHSILFCHVLIPPFLNLLNFHAGKTSIAGRGAAQTIIIIHQQFVVIAAAGLRLGIILSCSTTVGPVPLPVTFGHRT